MEKRPRSLCIRFDISTIWAPKCLNRDELLSVHLVRSPPTLHRIARVPAGANESSIRRVRYPSRDHLRSALRAVNSFIQRSISSSWLSCSREHFSLPNRTDVILHPRIKVQRPSRYGDSSTTIKNVTVFMCGHGLLYRRSSVATARQIHKQQRTAQSRAGWLVFPAHG